MWQSFEILSHANVTAFWDTEPRECDGLLRYWATWMWEPFEILSHVNVRAFWDTEPCRLEEEDQLLRRAYCYHNQSDKWMTEAVCTSETSDDFCKTGLLCLQGLWRHVGCWRSFDWLVASGLTIESWRIREIVAQRNKRKAVQVQTKQGNQITNKSLLCGISQQTLTMKNETRHKKWCLVSEKKNTGLERCSQHWQSNGVLPIYVT
jgi:hypothetical protein